MTRILTTTALAALLAITGTVTAASTAQALPIGPTCPTSTALIIGPTCPPPPRWTKAQPLTSKATRIARPKAGHR
jgi:hypothetical protein